MQKDFHYYATYCAAYLAGYSHEESLDICYCAQMVDWCSATFLSKIKGPIEAATTQSSLELADTRTDLGGIQNITRIWSSFHFLPYDLYAKKNHCSRRYLMKYRLICNPNSDLLIETINQVKDEPLQAIGLSMHVLADTWAHRYFAGTPALVINNTTNHFYEIIKTEDGEIERKMTFRHSMSTPDDFDKSIYSNSLYQSNEVSIMNVGHGRAGHLPDYSFIKYKYMPAWAEYEEIIKDNQSDYYSAFCQMVYAMKYLRGEYTDFEKDTYDSTSVEPWKDTIKIILAKRQHEKESCDDWKAFGEKLSGKEICDFDMTKYQEEYINAPIDEKDNTFLGKFIIAALKQKSMVTNRIFKSNNYLAGISVDHKKDGLRGIKAYFKLLNREGSKKHGKSK